MRYFRIGRYVIPTDECMDVFKEHFDKEKPIGIIIETNPEVSYSIRKKKRVLEHAVRVDWFEKGNLGFEDNIWSKYWLEVLTEDEALARRI